MSNLIGRQIGPYEIKDLIGQGGMAAVYRAYQTSLNRPVAIKVLAGWMAQDTEFVQRFRQEALAAGALRHPNILPIHDTGTFEGQPYIVMDYVPTGTLADLLRKGPLPPDLAANLAAQIADALDHVHRRGIVHRDLKPTNILMDEDGRPLLADFGIAQAIDSGPRLTQTGSSVGTPEYMSPEQAQGARVDGRSDIYSLGIMLYQMLTGRVPFSATTPMATLYQVVHQPPPPPRQVNPNIPQYLENAILRAVAKQPTERFQSADQMAAMLRHRHVVKTPTKSPHSPWPFVAGVSGATVLIIALLVLLNAFSGRPPTPLATVAPTPNTAALAAVVASPVLPTSTSSPVPSTSTPAITVVERVVTATPQPTATPVPPTQTPVVVVVTATPVPATSTPKQAMLIPNSNANVRAGPGTGYEMLGTVSAGRQLPVTGKTPAGDWWQFAYEGRVAWIAASLVTAEPDAAGAPIIADIPTPPAVAAAPIGTTAPAQPGVVLDFENFGVWKRGDEPYGTFAQSSENKHGGSYAGKLAYDVPAITKNYVVFRRQPPLALPGQPAALTLWVYGDGSQAFLNAWIQDSQGEVRQFTFGQIKHKDVWQPMTLRLDTRAGWPQGPISGPDNGRLDYPISFDGLLLDAVPDGSASKGVIYVDDLMTGEVPGAPQATPSGSAPGPVVNQPQGPLAGHIVFTTDNGGSSEVAVLDVATRATWRLFSNARQPDIRGDGRVVMNGIGGGKNNLITVNLDGSREIITGPIPRIAIRTGHRVASAPCFIRPCRGMAKSASISNGT